MMAMGGCDAPTPEVAAGASHSDTARIAPIATLLDCVPDGGALTVAHRGTDRNSSLPENSLEGLAALIERGILFAEVDVARTRDGVHVLYHDGVWETGSNGRGPVAGSRWREVQTYSLKDWRGRPTQAGVPRLEDALDMARGKIHLEIDFKTSADYEQVIGIIDENDLSSQVVLIAYSDAAARKLRRLAPDMWISVPVDQMEGIAPPVMAWVNDRVVETDAPTVVKLGGAREDVLANRALLEVGELAVTDYALSERPVVGDADGFAECVAMRR